MSESLMSESLMTEYLLDRIMVGILAIPPSKLLLQAHVLHAEIGRVGVRLVCPDHTIVVDLYEISAISHLVGNWFVGRIEKVQVTYLLVHLDQPEPTGRRFDVARILLEVLTGQTFEERLRFARDGLIDQSVRHD